METAETYFSLRFTFLIVNCNIYFLSGANLLQTALKMKSFPLRQTSEFTQFYHLYLPSWIVLFTFSDLDPPCVVRKNSYLINCSNQLVCAWKEWNQKEQKFLWFKANYSFSKWNDSLRVRLQAWFALNWKILQDRAFNKMMVFQIKNAHCFKCNRNSDDDSCK